MPPTKIRFNDARLGEVALSPTQNLTIGRHPDNDIRLNKDDVASRFHCVIEPGPNGTFTLKDLGSRNGTTVNGRSVSTAPLKAGDTVQVGKSAFTVVVEAEAKQRRRVSLSANPERLAPWAAELRTTLDDIPPKASEDELITLINADDTTSQVLESTSDGSLTVRLLLLLSSKGRATDIHLEPKREHLGVRIRVDGGMVHVVDLPIE
ncbi:MAG: FHA domain-containing protein, partial [Phycisphaerales bacterium]